MIDLRTALAIDIFTLIVCVFLLLRHGRIAHSHPAAIYLFFHLYTVTFRLFTLNNGAPTLFSGWGHLISPVSEDEIIRAALLFDLALFIMTVAWLKASRADLKKHGPMSSSMELPQATLSKAHIWRIVVFAFPVGIIGLFLFARIPGVTIDTDIGAWGRSTWVSMSATWSGLALLALIYWYGFRKPLVFLMVVYLSLMAVQGFHRFRFYIPLILLMQIYLDRRQLRWPSLPLWGVLVAAFLLFFPLKAVGSTVQSGGDFNQVLTLVATSWENVSEGAAGDQAFLDMFASALTLVDHKGEFYYGRPYLYLLVLPVPRPLWPDKPSFADYLHEISTSWRPMGQAGMIVTYLGEAYVNFWYIGVLFIPYLLAYYLAQFYFKAYRRGYFSVWHFAYLLLAANLIQVYRDGLTSIVVFVFANMMPLALIVILHIIAPLRPNKVERFTKFPSLATNRSRKTTSG
jgi:hypothetical protein